MSAKRLAYIIKMRWREKTVENERGSRTFVHVAVQLDALDYSFGPKPQRTKVVDKFMAPDIAQGFLDTVEAGTKIRGETLTKTGDFFRRPHPKVAPHG